MLYQLKRPSLDDLARWAARLKRLDAAALSSTSDDAAQRARLVDTERQQAGAMAMPAAWRTRDRVRAPEWPALADLELWTSLGASHALRLLKPPSSFAVIPRSGQPEPHVLAYSTAYLAVMKGYWMPDQHPTAPMVLAQAEALDLGEKTLEVYMSGDASALAPEYQAEVLVALHKMFGLNPLAKAWIIVDGKIYPTAAAASAVRRRHGLECDVVEQAVVELGGVTLIKCVAECRDTANGRSERSTAFVSWTVETVDEWGTNAQGKRYPLKKSWNEPNPEQVADKMMKAQTKAIRRATLLFAALGSSAAEDVPGQTRDWITQIDEPPAALEPPHPDEAGR